MAEEEPAEVKRGQAAEQSKALDAMTDHVSCPRNPSPKVVVSLVAARGRSLSRAAHGMPLSVLSPFVEVFTSVLCSEVPA